jgi:hypothetical protein
MVLGFCAEEAVPSQHGLSEQMEEAAKEWFTAGPQDKVKFEVNLMVAQGPLGKQQRNRLHLSSPCLSLWKLHCHTHLSLWKLHCHTLRVMWLLYSVC